MPTIMSVEHKHANTSIVSMVMLTFSEASHSCLRGCEPSLGWILFNTLPAG